MGSLSTRFAMCLLVALPSVQPVLACECEPCGCYDYDCQYTSETCEPWFDYAVEESVGCGGCAYDETIADKTHDQDDALPPPAATKSTPLEKPVAKPKSELPTPATKTPTPVMPAPPIAVPQPDNEIVPPANDLFPGPEAPAGSSTNEPAPEEKSQIDELFEEPSAISEPQPLPQSELPTPKPNSTDALFVEPKQATDQQSEDESTENVVPPKTEEKANAFEDLFGPSNEEPKENATPDPNDPFGQNEFPSERPAASGLASSEIRNWADHSQEFSCQARLVSLTAVNVVLERAVGDRVVVPLSSLSDTDLIFVQEHVRALRNVLARESLAAQFALSWSH